MKKKYKATLLKADTPTINGRIYSWEALTKAVNDYIERTPEEVRVGMGELYHEDSIYGIALDKITHKVEEISLDNVNKQVDVVVQILDTPNGNIVEQLGATNFSAVPCGCGEIDDNNNVISYSLNHINLTLNDKAADYAKLEEIK